MNVIGIDPGQSGGIAMVGDDPCAIKMPETERDIFDALNAFSTEASSAFIEAVHAMPKQGVSSTFKFGQNFGFLRGCLIALGIPFESVAPQKWQKALGCLTHGDKNVSKRRAQELFPGLKINHYVADALLIALYGQRLQRARHPANLIG